MWLILVSAMLPVVAEPSAARASGCYFREVAVTREPATIRAEPRASGAFVRVTTAGEDLAIINAIHSNGSCWLETDEGWLIYDAQVISDTFFSFEAGVGETRQEQTTCLPGQTVTISGPMNIRKSPTTESPVVASAKAGENYTVYEIAIGIEWCWMKVWRGWLANTERVQATNPGDAVDSEATAPKPEPADDDNCCFDGRLCTTAEEWIDGYWAHLNELCGAPPRVSLSQLSKPRVVGSEAFVHAVSETLDLMEIKTPAVYRYVVSATTVVEEHGPEVNACGLAYIGAGRTSLGSCFDFAEAQTPELLNSLAAVLAHEACHHKGDDMKKGEFDHEPCYKAGREAHAAISA